MVDSFQDSSSAQVTSIDQDSVQMSLTSRPRNTTKQYEPKQVEFRVRCRPVNILRGLVITTNSVRIFVARKATQMVT